MTAVHGPRRALLALMMVCLSTATALALAEAAVRWLHLAPPLPVQYAGYASSPWFSYGPRPFSHQQGTIDSGEFTYDFTHNRFGLRDAEHEFAKPAGTFRILALGDSFTYGVGAPDGETYLDVLERLIGARAGVHPRVEIIRAGVPRFFPEAERILLERLGMKFAPDLVIVGFVPNDVVDTCLGLDAVTVDASGFMMTRQAKELGPAGLYLYLHSHVARMALARYSAWRNHRACPMELPYDPALPGHEEAWRKVEQEYSRMAEIAAAAGARLVVVHIAERAPWTGRSAYPAARLAAWAVGHGAGFVDTLPAMRAAPDPQALHYRRDPHCTSAGYALIGREVGRYLTAAALIP